MTWCGGVWDLRDTVRSREGFEWKKNTLITAPAGRLANAASMLAFVTSTSLPAPHMGCCQERRIRLRMYLRWCGIPICWGTRTKTSPYLLLSFCGRFFLVLRVTDPRFLHLLITDWTVLFDRLRALAIPPIDMEARCFSIISTRLRSWSAMEGRTFFGAMLESCGHNWWPEAPQKRGLGGQAPRQGTNSTGGV